MIATNPNSLKEQPSMEDIFIQSTTVSPSNYKSMYGVYRDHNNLPFNKNPIEHISHHIWIKSHQSTTNKEIPEKTFSKFVDQLMKMETASQEFKHIIWCNDQELIPLTVKAVNDLKDNHNIDMEIREISSLNNQIKHLDILNKLIENQKYGVAIDILKYEVVRVFGGVVLDLNYILHTDKLVDLLDSYNFFAHGGSGSGGIAVENHMFAAYKGHPILATMHNVIERFLSLRENGQRSNVEVTGELFDIWKMVVNNNFNHNDDEGKIDEIFPTSCEKYDEDNNLVFNGCNAIGKDGFGQSWAWE